jgi:hypothetical protein
MTRPAQSDGRLFYLLALYAALDRAVTESGDPNIAATVEGFLPGTTGEGQRGWSGNLEEFLGRDFPGVNDALSALVSTPDLTPSQLSRLVYVLGSLLHLPEGRVGIAREQIVQGLSLAAPTPAPGPEPTPATGVAYATGAPDPGNQLFTVLEERFHKQDDYLGAAAYAVRIGCLDAIVASIPPCGACLTTQGNIECVVVDTHFEDKSLTIGQVEAILDPRNWDKTAVLFFCKMKDLKTRKKDPYKGWGRVLETASGWCGVLPELKTQLKFYKAEYPNGGVVQYDLDDSLPNQGDGKATVDKGWLKVVKGTKANRNAGVTVTTRKVVHINGLWPVAQKMFVCVMGYGDAARDMLLGHATNPPPNLVAWSADPAPLVSTQPMEAFLTAPVAGTQAVQPPPAPPVGGQAVQAGPASTASGSGAPAKTAAGLAVSMLSDYLAEAANDSAAIAAKFASKELTVDDLAKFSAKLGVRMASEPWRFLQKLSELPPTTPTGVPIKGDDGF